jgi:ankyrin repeat protein
LLKAGATVDSCDEYGHTPIFIAARQGLWSICEKLLLGGANMNDSGLIHIFAYEA